MFFYLDITNYHSSYFKSKIFDNIKEFENIDKPIDIKRYLIPSNSIKRHNSGNNNTSNNKSTKDKYYKFN